MSKKYSVELDVLKAICIIAVVFYHIGWLKTGYLGVDVFFVINGFLILPTLINQIGGGKYQYIKWLRGRALRLWPLILIASAVCLLIGYVGMLPDDYENLAQSVIASDLMSNNILSAITTRNYWDTVNEFKPLMHLWYVGILVEFYIIIPLIFFLAKKIGELFKMNFRKTSIITLTLLFFLSLTLYLLPNFSASDKFYYLPFRLFELCAGGLVGMYLGIRPRKDFPIIGITLTITLTIILCCSLFLTRTSAEYNAVSGLVDNTMLISNTILLPLTVLFSCLACRFSKWDISNYALSKIAFLGKISFSIFIWHQILLAFYRYYISTDMSVGFVVVLWSVTILLSLLTYYFVEQRVTSSWKTFGVCCVALVFILIPSVWLYSNAGVVRDVPECNVYKGQVHKGLFAEYCDRVYTYDKEFPSDDNGKINVLVEGISFGRDFANVLLESVWADKINLSYIYNHNEKYCNRYANADYIFTFMNKPDVPKYVWNNIKSDTKVYGLGTKNYGESNGIIYQHRHKPNYQQLTIDINPNYHKLNMLWKAAWGKDNYIDLIAYSTAPDGKVRVFNNNGEFISSDCRHFTPGGARFMAEAIDFKSIFNNNEY